MREGVSILQHFQKKAPESHSAIEAGPKQPHICLGVADIGLAGCGLSLY